MTKSDPRRRHASTEFCDIRFDSNCRIIRSDRLSPVISGVDLMITEIQEWLCEKRERLDEVDRVMATSHLTPDDKEAYRAFVGKQYAQFRQLESELDMHTQRIQQVFQNVVNTIVQYPKLSDRLKAKLQEITRDWDELRRLMRDRLACMVQVHRGRLFALLPRATKSLGPTPFPVTKLLRIFCVTVLCCDQLCNGYSLLTIFII
ncbi:unnamed protein product [Echinostoma caproni]|uniref:DUF148 domain-containing protein n=1 Tax=Echinostoma caproni TaxID=27848 RepID=A0A183AZE7_9TREM|nr:unnamed protein product [Echinostoma caproni]